MKKEKIAVLGLGAMGSRMARNFLNAGYRVRVWNRTASACEGLVEKGASAFATPRECATDADVVISMVRDDAASKAVWLDEKEGALLDIKEGAVAMECSTLSLGWWAALSAAMEKQRISFFDAPVVGTRPQAEAGQLVFLVGAEEEKMENIVSVLEVNAGAIHFLGKSGKGMLMKLAVNGFFAIQVAAFAEMIGVLERQGIDRKTGISLLSALPITSPALKGIGAAMSAANYSPLFPIELVEKDLSYLSKLYNDLSLSEVARLQFKKAMDAGFGDDNIAGISKIFDHNDRL